jgi:hypothetical protein
MANNNYVQIYYSHLAATNQGPGFQVMGLGRFGRGYLRERRDMMAAVSAIGFVAPPLDPRNTGANVAGGEGNNVGNTAVAEIHVARAAENKNEGVGGMPHWNRKLRMQWRASGGSRATECCKSTQGWTFVEYLHQEGLITKVKYLLVHFVFVFIILW